MMRTNFLLIPGILLSLLVLADCTSTGGSGPSFPDGDQTNTDGDLSDGDINDGEGDVGEADVEQAEANELEAEADRRCSPGAFRCRGSRQVQRCADDGAVWEYYRDCQARQICIDADCQAYGDGDLDGDEDSDYPLASGECRYETDCEGGDICDRSWGITIGRCIKPCTAPDGACPETYTCIDNPENLNFGLCVMEQCHACGKTADCPDGSYCELLVAGRSGNCRPHCEKDENCAGGLNCRKGRCVVGEGKGDCGGSCKEGYICVAAFNSCVLNCPDCEPPTGCDAERAPECWGQWSCNNPVVCSPLLPACCYGYSCSACLVGTGLGYCI